MSVPRPLAWLLGAVLLAGVAWTVAVPPYQVPDEDAHAATVETLVELHRRPADDARPDEQARASTAQERTEALSGFLGSYQRLEARPAWSAAQEARWRAAVRGAPRDDGGGRNGTENTPPTYYAYAALGYLAAASGDPIDQLGAMRLLSVLLLPGVALAAWLLAGELTGRDRRAQLLAAAVAGLAPMVTFVGTGVTPDALLLPLWGLALWLMVRPRSAVALVAVTILAIAVKPIAVALVPGVAWTLVRHRVRAAVALPAVAIVGVVAALAVAPGGIRRFLSYLWQFYVPADLPGQAHVAALDAWPLRDVWLEGTTGAFGWLEVRFPWPVYAALAALGALALVLAWPALRRFPALLAPAVAGAALLAGLHLIEADQLARAEGGFAQGRYLLGFAPLAGSVAALALARLPRAAGGAALGGMAAWQLASLAVVVARFHA